MFRQYNDQILIFIVTYLETSHKRSNERCFDQQETEVGPFDTKKSRLSLLCRKRLKWQYIVGRQDRWSEARSRKITLWWLGRNAPWVGSYRRGTPTEGKTDERYDQLLYDLTLEIKRTLTVHRFEDLEVCINIKCDEDTGQHVVDWAEGRTLKEMERGLEKGRWYHIISDRGDFAWIVDSTFSIKLLRQWDLLQNL